jgi:hypothetical protein
MGVGMKFEPKDPPRKYPVGNTIKFEIADCGTMHLAPDEQITIVTEKGGELDVTRKSWGFYATPSLNGRLSDFGLRGVLIRNTITGRYFVLLVENGQEMGFEAYIEQERLEIVSWLDSTQSLDALRSAVTAGERR